MARRSPPDSKSVRDLLKSVEQVPYEDLKAKVRQTIQEYFASGRAEEGTSASPRPVKKAGKRKR
jgi:hypothetical protein